MKLLFFIGTRQEAIKLSPLIREMKKYGELFHVKVCISAHDRATLDQILDFFDIRPDLILDIMTNDENPYYVTTMTMTKIRDVIRLFEPDYLIVQGNTTTVFAGALAAYYEKVNVAHVEAGIRDFNLSTLYPDGMNGRLITQIANLHFAPNLSAKDNLLMEAINDNNIFVVGYPGVDSLSLCLDKIRHRSPKEYTSLESIDFNKKIILVMGNRGGTLGESIENIYPAVKAIAHLDSVEIVYAVDNLQSIRRSPFRMLSGYSNVHLVSPLDYPSTVYLMSKSYIIITNYFDTAVEAATLGIPVVMVEAGADSERRHKEELVKVICADHKNIINEINNLFENRIYYNRMARNMNAYDDGMVCIRIRQLFSGLYEDNINNKRSKKKGQATSH